MGIWSRASDCFVELFFQSHFTLYPLVPSSQPTSRAAYRSVSLAPFVTDIRDCCQSAKKSFAFGLRTLIILLVLTVVDSAFAD